MSLGPEGADHDQFGRKLIIPDTWKSSS
jgi:hypothetical protein